MVWFVFPLATAGVSGVFGLAVLKRFLDGRKRHNLLWALGLFAIMAAALCQLAAELSGGWTDTIVRVYYVVIAMGPAYLGAGTLYLMRYERASDYFLYAVIALTAVQAVVCAVSQLDEAAIAAAPVGTGVAGTTVAMRAMVGVLNGIGTIALLAGAVISYRASQRTHNLLIAAGTIVFAAGGSVAGLFPEEGGLSTGALYAGNLVGIVLLFLGFWMARASRPEPAATAAAVALVPSGPL